MNISFEAEKFFCIIISLDDYFNLIEERKQEDISICKFAIQHIAHEFFSSVEGTFFMFEDKQNEIGILFCYYKAYIKGIIILRCFKKNK